MLNEIVVPPAVRLAWLALAAAPPGVFRRGAVVHVANTLNVQKPRASKMLDSAMEAGLVHRARSGGLVVARPLGRLPEEYLADALAEEDGVGQKVMIRGVPVDLDAAIVVAPEPDSQPGLLPADGPGVERAKVRTVKGLRRRGDWHGRFSRIERAEYLAGLWTAHRRRLLPGEPTWEPSEADRGRILKAVQRLEEVRVPQEGWSAYVDWLYATYTRWAQTAPWPTTGMLASSKVLDWWLEALGPRSVDPDDAAALLASAGFADVHPAMVIDIAAEFAGHPEALPSALKPRTREAVLWLLAHYAEVKMQPVDYEAPLRGEGE